MGLNEAINIINSGYFSNNSITKGVSFNYVKVKEIYHMLDNDSSNITIGGEVVYDRVQPNTIYLAIQYTGADHSSEPTYHIFKNIDNIDIKSAYYRIYNVIFDGNLHRVCVLTTDDGNNFEMYESKLYGTDNIHYLINLFYVFMHSDHANKITGGKKQEKQTIQRKVSYDKVNNKYYINYDSTKCYLTKHNTRVNNKKLYMTINGVEIMIKLK